MFVVTMMFETLLLFRRKRCSLAPNDQASFVGQGERTTASLLNHREIACAPVVVLSWLVGRILPAIGRYVHIATSLWFEDSVMNIRYSITRLCKRLMGDIHYESSIGSDRYHLFPYYRIGDQPIGRKKLVKEEVTLIC